MFSIASTFKPFEGPNRINQVNALASWRALSPDIEILAFGEAEGLGEQVPVFGIQQIAEIPLSSEGLPRIDLILRTVSDLARHDLIVYLNADIILFADFIEALKSIHLPRFLMIGQRTDVHINGLLDFGDGESRERTRKWLLEKGEIHRPAGIDYFAFRRGSLPALPPMYAGAAGWDNLTIFLCRQNEIPVVDATLAATVFHPNHPYKLLADGRTVAFNGQAAMENQSRLPPGVPRFCTTDASFWLERGQLKSAWSSPRHAWRFAYTYPILKKWGLASRLASRVVASLLERLGTQVIFRTWGRASIERQRIRSYELTRRGKGERFPKSRSRTAPVEDDYEASAS